MDMISKLNAERIKEDAVFAIQKLREIAMECERGYVSATYLKEKITPAENCCRFIRTVVEITLKEGQP